MMGEISVYYVPDDQAACSSRARELAEFFWQYGIFLDTTEINERLLAERNAGRSLPHCHLNIDQKFGGMGVSDEMEVPVPNYLYEIACPVCEADIVDACYAAWSCDSDVECKDRVVICDACGASSTTKDLKFGEPMTFARFFVFVSDCDRENWDPGFRTLLEQLLGPCSEYWEWST
jgi:hypothetical protein